MSAEPPPESPTGASAHGTSGPAPQQLISAGKTPLQTAPDVASPLRTEQQLNSPSRLTLRLLAVVFAFTFLPWVAAKVACNDRETPVRAPLEPPTEVLAKQPKSAGLELQQRAASYRYREAAELAKGALAAELLAADARCVAEPHPCEARRAQSSKIFTRAVLVSRGPNTAHVRAETQIGDQVERVTLRLEADGGRWFVVSREPFAGELGDPAPASEVSPVSLPLTLPLQRAAPHPAAGHSTAPSLAPAQP
jgi:hypothetical protein